MVHLETYVDCGTSPNEDVVWSGDDAVVVLDGATGLTDRRFSDAPSDGRWYVEELTTQLAARLEVNCPISTIATDAIGAVRERYDALCDEIEDVPEHERPSASGVICRWSGADIDYFVLGDSSFVARTTAGVETVLGAGPRSLDRAVIDEMISIREAEEPGDSRTYDDRQSDAEISQAELLKRVEPMLIEHRKLKNTPGGYWTFGLDPAATSHASTGTIPRASLVDAIAFTDGFEPLCTVYDAVADWGRVLEYVAANGIERAVRVLRAFEASDPDCRRYPRLKRSDDVGVAYLEP
ncbi:hypothetical protein [Natronorubrum thiooxidans]|uniref:Protein phosphatase 2C n=1 Tax=Natronorubrum thiooxidans TaxID=308853 RepID=A0A1N7E2M4_9EURY|nr:hypothetical protein [Natronorubrum thiooxidans]SIR82314.1 hypothetical protein SAMN05421752_103153 [Natronorubrum thiooxidans]